MSVTSSTGKSGRFTQTSRKRPVVRKPIDSEALLPGQSATEAHDLAEFIRNTVEQHSFPLEDRSIKMTSSIGVATMSGDISEATELLKLADKAVYQAKNTGRNKVCNSLIQEST